MSHLSTLIHRVKKRKRLGHDELLPKTVRNLREYVDHWEDYSADEYELAEKLYQENKEVLDDSERRPFPESSLE